MSRASPRRVALAMTCLAENFPMVPLCQALAETAHASSQPLGRALGPVLQGFRCNPIVLGTLDGLAGTLLDWLWSAPLPHRNTRYHSRARRNPAQRYTRNKAPAARRLGL